MAIRINSQGIEIDGTTHPLYSGSIHYWRLERTRWPEIIDRAVEMGFKFICTCIPWSVHERSRGGFDFGEEEPGKDIGAFIDLCEQRGLYVLVRPGPHVNAEITYSGFPERIFQREELLARTADGTLAFIPAPPRFFPAPCYASDEFFNEVGVYFDALCPILSERLHPRGPIVGIQPDNENSFFFRTGPFDMDYSEPSINLYRKYLSEKHPDLDNLNHLYGTRYSDYGEIVPPRTFAAEKAAELPYYLDWAEYRELYVFYGIHRIARMLRERGMNDVFYFHNYPSAYPVSPFHIPKMESQIDVAGLDIYKGRNDYQSVKVALRFLSGTSRLPFVPELGSGAWPWWKPLFLKDQELCTRAALMNGMKAANFYMVVDRERWYGAPVARDGRKRNECFDFYCNFNRFIKKNNFHEYKMKSEVLLLSVADYERIEQMQSLLDPLPNFEPVSSLPQDWFVPQKALDGIRDPVGAMYKKQWRAFWLGFNQAGLPVTLADSAVEQSVIDRFKIVAVPSFDFMNLRLQKRLLLYALKGGVLLVGPRCPRYNERFVEESKFASHLLKPVGSRERTTIGGLVVEHADMFLAEYPLLEDTREEVCAYWRHAEKGKIVHLGFVFQDYTGIEQSPGVAGLMKRVASLAGITAAYPVQDPVIETVLHERNGDRLLFVANPSSETRIALLKMHPGGVLNDIDTGEQFKGPSPELEMPAQTVRIFRVEERL